MGIRMPVSAGTPALPVIVVQPLPGIGDMVWHVAHIRAIAAWAGGAVTVLTKPRSMADQLFADEPAVHDVQWVDMNPSGRRGRHDGLLGFIRLVRLLRAGRYRSIIFLHHGRTLAMAAWLAGIPDRRGYGWGSQRPFLTHGPFLPKSVAKRHQLKRATAWIEASGIPLASDEPRLTATPPSRQAARDRASVPTRFLAMGIGSSETQRNWGVEKFAALARLLFDAGWPAIVLVGGPDDDDHAEAIRRHSGHPDRFRTALGWALPEVMGLLAEAGFCVANNTGVMNLAAALGTRTYGVFGTTFPFDHASEVRRVMAPDIGIDDGAGRVTLEMMVDAITADRGGLGPVALPADQPGSIRSETPVKETRE
jgi:heptosyltransferase-2